MLRPFLSTGWACAIALAVIAPMGCRSGPDRSAHRELLLETQTCMVEVVDASLPPGERRDGVIATLERLRDAELAFCEEAKASGERLEGLMERYDATRADFEPHLAELSAARERLTQAMFDTYVGLRETLNDDEWTTFVDAMIAEEERWGEALR